MMRAAANPVRSGTLNGSTRLYAALLGSVAGLGGILHGVFEIMQGHKPPTDIGTRIGAFTVVPDYWTTGVCAIVAGTALIACCLLLLPRRHGPSVFLGLSLALFLVGGGVALVPCALLVWGVSTRIRKPLSWWGNLISPGARRVAARIWPWAFAAGFALFILGFCIWLVILPPGIIRAITPLHYVMWSLLALVLVLLILAMACGFARDIERRAV